MSTAVRVGRFFSRLAVKWKRLPLFARTVYVLTLISFATHVAFYVSPAFADLYNATVSTGVRGLLAAVSGLVPFSLAEALLILVLPLMALLMVYAFRIKEKEKLQRLLAVVLAFSLLLYNLFVMAFAAGYRGKSLDQKMGIESLSPSEGEDKALYRTAIWLAEELDTLVPTIDYDAYGASISPYSFEQATRLLKESYEDIRRTDGIGTPSVGLAKPVALSHLMSHTHILGVYTFFTGEANVNMSFTDFNTVYTAAHEMAHQRGFAREDEANFMAFLACYNADDHYLRYAGCWELLRYLLSDLSSANSVYYTDVCDRIPDEVWGDQARYNALFAPYRESVAATVSGAINDTYLKSQGTAGRVSYRQVVALAVSYFENRVAPTDQSMHQTPATGV